MGKVKQNRFDLSQVTNPTYEEQDALLNILIDKDDTQVFEDDELLIPAMKCLVKRILKSFFNEIKVQSQSNKHVIYVYTTPDRIPGIFISIVVSDGYGNVIKTCRKHFPMINNGQRYHEFVKAMYYITGIDNSSCSSNSFVPVSLVWHLDN